MTNVRKRAIKMYWKMAKKKCPFQTEEIVNGYLEGFIDCAEYLLLQNTELEKENANLKALRKYELNVSKLEIEKLEKENAELKSGDCWKSCEYVNPKAELIGQHIKDV